MGRGELDLAGDVPEGAGTGIAVDVVVLGRGIGVVGPGRRGGQGREEEADDGREQGGRAAPE
ncbi:hypothetical protein GCM10029992_27880 [Glycomyces albus]